MPLMPKVRDIDRKLMAGYLVTRETKASWAEQRWARHPSKDPPDPEDLDGACPYCPNQVENLDHLFWTCVHARRAWDTINRILASWPISTDPTMAHLRHGLLALPLQHDEALFGTLPNGSPMDPLPDTHRSPTAQEDVTSHTRRQFLCIQTLHTIWRLRWIQRPSQDKPLHPTTISRAVIFDITTAISAVLAKPADPYDQTTLPASTIIGTLHPLLDPDATPDSPRLPPMRRRPHLYQQWVDFL
jgi:hypothetical protein